ncbi:MAG: pyrroline-5-carboxylate reductase [Candidatus Omnitrophica bacterium]|nr:pyrroline-5-carboxylate reductase [Candidatus Omnitrophota bacterium]
MGVLRGLTIGIIGAGTMGQALLRGLLAQGIPRRALRVADANPQTRRLVERRFRLPVEADGREVARRSDLVILAVKPQQFPEAVPPLARHLTRPATTRGGGASRPLVVTIAAGITLRWLQVRLPGVPLVRVMPNLPATVGCGFAALAAGRTATRRHRAMARALFGAVGTVVELPERQLDAVTAVSGSGPAYVFYLARIWEEAARKLGLPRAAASEAVRRTLEGSVRLLLASGEPAEALIAKVASKGGTTEAALKVLARRRMPAQFAEALRAAARRSRELSSRYQIPIG